MAHRGFACRSVLVILTLLLAAGVAGCGRGAGGGGREAPPSQADAPIDGVAWQPFALQPGQYFKYAVVDHPVQKKGWVSLAVTDKGGGELAVEWRGEREDGMKLATTSVAKREEIVVLSRPAIVTSPVATPFLAAILPQWWEKMAGFQMKVGANWSVVLDEMMPAGFTAKVEGNCAVAGVKGFKVRLTAGDVVMSEACISPRLPLPLEVRVNDIQNKVRYEAGLVEYGEGRR